MAGLFVPNDWTEATDGFCTLTVQVPNSAWWRAMYRGAIYQLMVPETFDAETGDTEQAAAVAATAYQTLDFQCP